MTSDRAVRPPRLLAIFDFAEAFGRPSALAETVFFGVLAYILLAPAPFVADWLYFKAVPELFQYAGWACVFMAIRYAVRPLGAIVEPIFYGILAYILLAPAPFIADWPIVKELPQLLRYAGWIGWVCVFMAVRYAVQPLGAILKLTVRTRAGNHMRQQLQEAHGIGRAGPADEATTDRILKGTQTRARPRFKD